MWNVVVGVGTVGKATHGFEPRVSLGQNQYYLCLLLAFISALVLLVLWKYLSRPLCHGLSRAALHSTWAVAGAF